MADHEADLERIRIENAKANIEAGYAQNNLYRQSD